MTERKSIRRLAFVLLTVLSLLALTACGGKTPPAQSEPSAPAEEPAVSAAPAAQPSAPAETPPPSGGTEGAEPPAADDGTVRVDSVEALLEAIAPGAQIVLEPGRYNLTEFLNDYPNARDMDVWNDAHEYVSLGFVFDGTEVTVRNVSGLSIVGGSDDPADTELVTEPRYAAVLNLENCEDVELACLTMGHTETGDCSGNVLDLDNCRNIFLRSSDLYGCGVYGLCAKNGCGGVYVSNSVIRDCEYGPFDIAEGDGEFLFTACTLAGSGWGGSYEPTRTSKLSFVGCCFGEGESNGLYFRADILYDGCVWSEITQYPDRGSDLEDVFGFYPALAEQLAFDASTIPAHTNWVGYVTVDGETGATEYLGLMGQDSMPSLIASLDLNDDGTGVLAYRMERIELTWQPGDAELAGTRGDGSAVTLSLHRMQIPDSAESHDWLLLRSDAGMLWFY